MKNNSELIHDVQKEKPTKKLADRIVLLSFFYYICKHYNNYYYM